MSAINNETNKKNGHGTAIFTTDMGTGKQGNISSVGTSSSGNGREQESNKAQSAGAPGSAGIVGSKGWLKATHGSNGQHYF